MITTLLCLAMGSSAPWTEVKANGFSFEMPARPELKTGPVTWPTTGQMIQTDWTSKVTTGDQQNDVATCFESTVDSPRMVGLLHQKFCKDAPGLRWDRTDATTQARECLSFAEGRRVLIRILQVGANVCMLTSSAKIDKATDDASPQMRRFVDRVKASGKPTVVSLTPWVVMLGKGFTFEMPQQTNAEIKDGTEPKLGKHKQTQWKSQVGDEGFSVTCYAGPTVASPKALESLLAACDVAQNKPVRTKLPSGSTQCTLTGSHSLLMRVFPLIGQTCVVAATRGTGDFSQDARRFVESFAKAK